MMIDLQAVDDRPIRDRRGAPRRPARLLRCFSPIPAVIRDLGRSGMCLEMVGQLPTASTHLFRIRHRSLFFALTGEIRWTRHFMCLSESADRPRHLFRCGVVFETPLPNDVEEFLLS